MLARDLVNTPANRMTPTTLAEQAAALAAETGLKIEVLGRAECKALGMGIFMAVAEESEQEPSSSSWSTTPAGKDLPTVVLVGKGVTFDSGGISIKPAEDMWKMKDDMAGAAAVIASAGRGGPVEAAAARRRPGAVRREPARRPGAEAGRCLHRHDRQNHGSDQHGRRGPHAAGRCAGLCRRGSARPQSWTSPP